MENTSDYDKIFLATLQRAINTLNELDDIIETNGDRQSKIDLELSDWLHKLQNDDTLSTSQVANIGFKIKALRKERESLRNEFALIQEFEANKKKLYEKSNREFLKNDMHLRLKKLNQPYSNRILTEEDFDKVLSSHEKETKTKRKYTLVNYEEFEKKLQQGESIKNIAKEFGCSTSILYHIKSKIKKVR